VDGLKLDPIPGGGDDLAGGQVGGFEEGVEVLPGAGGRWGVGFGRGAGCALCRPCAGGVLCGHARDEAGRQECGELCH
jgi:hypothetical protein